MEQNTETMDGIVAFLLEELKKEWTKGSQAGWNPLSLTVKDMQLLNKMIQQRAAELVKSQESCAVTDFKENVLLTKKVCVMERIMRNLERKINITGMKKNAEKGYEVYFSDDEWSVVKEIIRSIC